LNLIGLAAPFSQPPDQPEQHLANLDEFALPGGEYGIFNQANIGRELQVAFEFARRSERDLEKTSEIPIGRPTAPSAIFAGIDNAARRI